MLRSLLLFTLICTCGPAQIHAQFTLSADAGYSIGSFNHQLDLSGPTITSDQRDFLGTINSPTLAFEIDYAPATQKSSWGLRVQYSERGYRHSVKLDNGQFIEGPLNFSRVHYIDLMPKFTNRFNRVVSGIIGPYVSIGLKEEGNPFFIESQRLINTPDYGIHLETRVTLERLFFYLAYQRSIRKYNYSAATDPRLQPHGDAFSIANPSPISAFRIGVGGIIIR